MTAILMYSSVLEQDVYLLSDDSEQLSERVLQSEPVVFYYDEIEFLKGKDVAELKAVASVKKVMGPKARVVASVNGTCKMCRREGFDNAAEQRGGKVQETKSATPV
jgi:hypothetical protein